MNHGYRLTKYDPALRNGQGHFIGDDWTSMNEVGKSFNGVELTVERYLEVEDAHVEAVNAFAVESGVDGLALWQPHLRGDVDPALVPAGLSNVLHDGYEVPLADALLLLRAGLRENFWCSMEAEERFVLHIGWDYYLYVTSHVPCENAVRKAHELGLFAEPFVSPYFRGEGEPYPPADEEFWVKVHQLARVAGRPVAVEESPYGGCQRWHLVDDGERPVLTPRSTLNVWAGLREDELDEPSRLYDRGLEPDFVAVLPDADGVVRARASR